MSEQSIVTTMSASGQSSDVIGNGVDLILSGTWAGTVKLQVYANGGWVDTGDSWTANDMLVIETATSHKWRIDWTRVSGTLAYELKSVFTQL